MRVRSSTTNESLIFRRQGIIAILVQTCYSVVAVRQKQTTRCEQMSWFARCGINLPQEIEILICAK